MKTEFEKAATDEAHDTLGSLVYQQLIGTLALDCIYPGVSVEYVKTLYFGQYGRVEFGACQVSNQEYSFTAALSIDGNNTHIHLLNWNGIGLDVDSSTPPQYAIRPSPSAIRHAEQNGTVVNLLKVWDNLDQSEEVQQLICQYSLDALRKVDDTVLMNYRQEADMMDVMLVSFDEALKVRIALESR